ncbi:MAG: hypothetical protein C4324_07510 [Blastocatellia bacterium]
MKRLIIAAFLIFSAVGGAFAQRNPAPAIDRDPLLEQDAKHNLDVAWQAFRLKKAYKAVLMRFEETFAAYPQFSKIDEFLYLAGASSYYLSEGRGKQKVNPKNPKETEKFAPEKLRADAAVYLGILIEKHPESKYIDEAKKILEELKPKIGQ